MMVSKALTIEAAGRVANMSYVQILFAFVFEWMVWGVLPSLTSFLGTCLVCCSLVITAIFAKPKQKVERHLSIVSINALNE